MPLMTYPNRQPSSRRLAYAKEGYPRLTHYLFRYPAKFHPPVARALVETFSEPGETILDPFCGSGTLLIEAAVAGRNAIGVDLDPVASFVSSAKTRRPVLKSLERTSKELLKRLAELERPASVYERRQLRDIKLSSYRNAIRRHGVHIPSIPNILHWFRRYVIIDLARIRDEILESDVPKSHLDVFLLCFASIIRAASNADPVPVSGLEVTSHMRARDARGRVINPFDLFRRALSRAKSAIAEFCDIALPMEISARRGNAIRLTKVIRSSIDAVITSPPYHNAVDYYRRHTLEMYWLDLVQSQEDRLKLLPHYIGRSQVPAKHALLAQYGVASPVARRWDRRIRELDPARANAFRHYVAAMDCSLKEIAQVLDSGKLAVFVLGKSSWNGVHIPTTDLFCELASGLFKLDARYWYPLKNRYMSYQRRNGANIDKEYVLVLRRV